MSNIKPSVMQCIVGVIISILATEAVGQEQSAILRTNQTLYSGEILDISGRARRDHVIRLTSGQSIEVAMQSSFDAYVIVTGPGGFRAENDNGIGEGTNARLSVTAPSSGDYLVTSTSARPGEFGTFELTVRSLLSSTPSSQSRGTVYGVFAGVTDYPSGELYRAAEDAVDLSGTMVSRGIILPGNAVVLTNENATPTSIRDALLRFAPRMTQNDTMFFYFGGHGSRGAIAMPSGRITTHELSAILDQLPGRQLITIDACYSGSFQSIINNAPHRMGLFSSTDSETSYTAQQVEASGWLIHFLMRTAQGHAPTGRDRALQFGELVSFVNQGYRHWRAPQTLVAIAGDESRNSTLW